MLELENVVFRYSRRSEPVLRGVSLTLNEGEIGILLGKNGAGKTTFFNMISGYYPVDSGTITIDGEDITDLSEEKRARFLGRAGFSYLAAGRLCLDGAAL